MFLLIVYIPSTVLANICCQDSMSKTLQEMIQLFETSGEDVLPKPVIREPCICVPIYLCEKGDRDQYGIGLLDVRINNDNPCGSLSYWETCCTQDKILTEPVIFTPPKILGCGYRNENGVGFRIVNAEDRQSNFGEFPWMAAILMKVQVGDKITYVYQCGAAVIHPEAVITAAHCVVSKKPRELRIRAGEWDAQTTEEIYPHQEIAVRSIIIHEDFFSGGLYNDIAILFLKSSFQLTETIRTICLPDSNFAPDPKKYCYATGWGKDTFGEDGKYQAILKKVEVPVVERNKCESSLRKTRLGNRYNLHKSFICAGGEKEKDTCDGDGGSPLVCAIPGIRNRFVQYGIVSYGIGCGENHPAVYTNMPLFKKWIDDQMIRHNLETSYYEYEIKRR